MSYDIEKIVSHFDLPGEFVSAGPYGTGHINDTFRSVFNNGKETHYIHQRINHNVFTQPEKLMENVQRVTSHLREKVLAAGGNPDRECLTLIPSKQGESYATVDGNYWRTYIFIEGAQTYDLVEKPEHVFNAAYAFGNFQKLVADLTDPPLHDTIPDFHNTVTRYKQFTDALEADVAHRAKDCAAEIEFAKSHADMASVVVDALASGEIPSRVTHNDTKFNNVMIDDETDKGICVIDLDTVMPGAAMYDFGDSVRVGAATAVEDETDLSKVSISLDLFENLTHGYLSAAKEFLTPREVELLAFSAKLITFEIGLRFLADHLAGDVYFKTHRENHNLDRCRTQFKMVEDMENKFDLMEAVVKKYSK